MNLYIADIHFGHRAVIDFDGRPFLDAEEMDMTLIKLYNSRVNSTDEVYLLGDVCFKNEKPEEWYLRQLKGKKHLIMGNHDVNILENPKAMSYFESVDKMLHVVDGQNHICLCHFPICEWNGFYKGAYHIYGHIHNKRNDAYQFMKTKERALNAGCMINNYTPASLNELIRNNAYHIKKDVQE